MAKLVIGALAGFGGAAIGVPVVAAALGFTAAGITAGSVAAYMMSTTAIAGNGAVAAGSAVAIWQSIGAAGLPIAAKAASVAAGALTAAVFF